MTTETETV